MRVYVSGPYTSAPEINTTFSIEQADMLLRAGMAPYVPHLNHYWKTPDGVEHDYEVWMDLDLAWLRVSEVVLRLPGYSPGADRETELALALNIPVVYGTADVLLKEIVM